MTESEAAAALNAEALRPPQPRFAGVLRFVRQQRLGTIGAVLIILIVIGSVAAPVLRTSDPEGFGVTPLLEGPSGSHFFGTNREGRDVWSRVLYGGRVSLKIGLATVVVAALGGTALALMAGYLGGPVDFAFGRVADVLIAFPSILFALTLHASLRDDLPNLGSVLAAEEFLLVVAICIVFTPVIFRIMRGNVLEQRGGDLCGVGAGYRGEREAHHVAPHLPEPCGAAADRDEHDAAGGRS